MNVSTFFCHEQNVQRFVSYSMCVTQFIVYIRSFVG